MQLSGESSAPGALTYTAVQTVDVGAHQAAMLLNAARPTNCAGRSQSIRAKTCSRFAKNCCHPYLAPW